MSRRRPATRFQTWPRNQMKASRNQMVTCMAGLKGLSGGRRPGSGRKPKSRLERAITGFAGHHGPVPSGPVGGAVPMVAGIERFDPPEDLPWPVRQVWLDLAPHAFANRTLTRGTAVSFGLLCRNIVLERDLAENVEQRGGANHRGIIQRVDAELLRFNLSPCGKALFEEAAPTPATNPLDKFLHRIRG